jgi:ribose transport system ATP-binding protein
VKALDDVDLVLREGEIVGLIGANGAGKSTLMRVISGAARPDDGHLQVDGEPRVFSNPRDALRAGIAVVAQETEMNLVAGQSVADNIFLGRPIARRGLISDRRMRAAARDLLELVGLAGTVAPEQDLVTLTPVQQRLVGIAQALSSQPRILILDEPSAALPSETAKRLQPVVRDLARRGSAVVYVSHRLGEIMDLCDRVVAMRDGRIAGALTRELATRERMVTLIGGKALEEEPPEVVVPAGETNPVVIRAARVSGNRVRDVDLEVRSGEILGVGGLHGSGRSELMRLIAGVQPPATGRLDVLDGGPCGSPRDAARRGVGYLPEGRSRMVFPRLTVRHNLTVTILSRLSRLIVDGRRERRLAGEIAAEVGVAGSINRPMVALSGGNQQKACLARWLLHGSRVLLLDEPTVGVDVHARAEIHRILRDLAGDGSTAIVVASAEPEELVLLCDRVVIMVEGRLDGELRAPFDADAVVSASYARRPRPPSDEMGTP